MDMHEADWNASPDVGEILAAEAWTRQALEKH
jgi:hypothetical protein